MFAAFFGTRLTNDDESSMPFIVYNALSFIMRNSPKRYSHLHEEAKRITDLLKEQDSQHKKGEPYDTRADKYFLAFKLACRVNKPKVRVVALDTIHKLISYGYLVGDSIADPSLYNITDTSSGLQTMPTINTTNESESDRTSENTFDDEDTVPQANFNSTNTTKALALVNQDDTSSPSGRKRSDAAPIRSSNKPYNTIIKRKKNDLLIDVIIETVYDCSMYEDSSVQLSVLKCLVTAVTTSSCHVHDASLLSAIRAGFIVCLTSQSAVIQSNAKGSLTQMISIVFQRMELVSKQVFGYEHELVSLAAQLEAITKKIEGLGPEEEVSATDLASKETISRDIVDITATRDGTRAQLEVIHSDCFQILRSLCKLSSKALNDNFDATSHRSLVLALDLILAVLRSSGSLLREIDPFVALIRDELLPALASNICTPVEDVFRLSAAIWSIMVVEFRSHLVLEVALFLQDVILEVIAHPNATISHKMTSLDVIVGMVRDPKLLVDLFLNYDCQPGSPSLVKSITSALEAASHAHYAAEGWATLEQEAEIRALAMEGQNSILRSLVLYARDSLAILEGKQTPREKKLAELDPEDAEMMKMFIGTSGNPLDLDDMIFETVHPKYASRFRLMVEQLQVARMKKKQSKALTSAASQSTETSQLVLPGLRTPSESDATQNPEKEEKTFVDAILSQPQWKVTDQHTTSRCESRSQKDLFEEGVALFNKNAHKGVDFLCKHGLLEKRFSTVVYFLLETPGLDKAQVFTMISQNDDFSLQLLVEFTNAMDFRSMTFDEALRKYLYSFYLRGESQVVDRIMETFSLKYCSDNPRVFPNTDAALSLAFSLVILNTDAHSTHIAKKMTKAQFLYNNRNINDGKGLDPAFMSDIYDRITQNEIKLKDQERESSVTLPPRKRLSMFVKESRVIYRTVIERSRRKLTQLRNERFLSLCRKENIDVAAYEANIFRAQKLEAMKTSEKLKKERSLRRKLARKNELKEELAKLTTTIETLQKESDLAAKLAQEAEVLNETGDVAVVADTTSDSTDISGEVDKDVSKTTTDATSTTTATTATSPTEEETKREPSTSVSATPVVATPSEAVTPAQGTGNGNGNVMSSMGSNAISSSAFASQAYTLESATERKKTVLNMIEEFSKEIPLLKKEIESEEANVQDGSPMSAPYYGLTPEQYARMGQLRDLVDSLDRKELTATYIAPSSSDIDVVVEIFQTVWPSACSTFSALLDATDTVRVAELCLDGFRYGVRISCMIHHVEARNRFIRSLAEFTRLKTSRDLRPKNISAINTILKIAHTEANFLESSWYDILLCISQLERLQLIARSGSGAPLELFQSNTPSADAKNLNGVGISEGGEEAFKRDEYLGGNNSNTNPMSPGLGSTSRQAFGSQNHRTERYDREAIESQTASSHLVLEKIDATGIERVFTQSPILTTDAITCFMTHLKAVALYELHGLSVPRLYSPQKMLEVLSYNLDRDPPVINSLWRIMYDFFNKAGAHAKDSIAMHIIDILRQIVSRFLSSDYLVSLNMQPHLFEPFGLILAHQQSLKNSVVCELLVQCLGQLITSRHANILSGWSTVFNILRRAASNDSPAIIAAAANLAVSTLCNNFVAILDPRHNAMFSVVRCFCAFASNPYSADVSFKSIDILGRCAFFSGNVIRAVVLGTPNPTVFPDTDSVIRHRSETSGDVSSTADEELQALLNVVCEDDFPSAQLTIWDAILHCLSKLISDSRLEVRTCALQSLYRVLVTNGNLFNQAMWRFVFHEVLFSIFAEVKAAGETGRLIDFVREVGDVNVSKTSSSTSTSAVASSVSPIASTPNNRDSFKYEASSSGTGIDMDTQSQSLARSGSTSTSGNSNATPSVPYIGRRSISGERDSPAVTTLDDRIKWATSVLDSDWNFTSCLSSLQTIIELFVRFQSKTVFLLGDLLELISSCVTQHTEYLAQVGLKSWSRLMIAAGPNFTYKEWDLVFIHFHRMLHGTLPIELISPSTYKLLGLDLTTRVPFSAFTIDPSHHRSHLLHNSRFPAFDKLNEDEEELNTISLDNFTEESPTPSVASSSSVDSPALIQNQKNQKERNDSMPRPTPPPGPAPATAVRVSMSSNVAPSASASASASAASNYTQMLPGSTPVPLQFQILPTITRSKMQPRIIESLFELFNEHFPFFLKPYELAEARKNKEQSKTTSTSVLAENNLFLMGDRHLLAVLDSILMSVDVARAFNNDWKYRSSLWNAGFLSDMQQSPPELFFHESHALSHYVQLIFSRIHMISTRKKAMLKKNTDTDENSTGDEIDQKTQGYVATSLDIRKQVENFAKEIQREETHGKSIESTETMTPVSSEAESENDSESPVVTNTRDASATDEENEDWLLEHLHARVRILMNNILPPYISATKARTAKGTKNSAIIEASTDYALTCLNKVILALLDAIHKLSPDLKYAYIAEYYVILVRLVDHGSTAVRSGVTRLLLASDVANLMITAWKSAATASSQ